MKLAYIYFTNVEKNEANIYQMFNMLPAFSEIVEVSYFLPFVRKKKLKEIMGGLPYSFDKLKLVDTHVPYFDKINFFEKLGRLLYFMHIHYWELKNYSHIYTRDISLLYYLSKLPNRLKPKQKIIYEAHKIYFKSSKKVTKEIEANALKHADVCIAISDGIKKDLVDIYDYQDKKIHVIANSVNPEEFRFDNLNKDLIKSKLKIPRDKIILTYTGSFLDWKGVDIVAEAINQCKRKDIFFMLVGGKGKDYSAIKNSLSEKINSGSALVLPKQKISTVRELLAASDLAMLPNRSMKESVRYTSPIKLFEYLASGLPVISSDLPSIRSIISEENGYFFQPDSPHSLVEAIEQALSDRENWSNISKRNLALVEENSWENRAKSIIEFVEESDRNDEQ
jgi:glycosyltransferase involved in cell wall biosynthesis